MNIFTGRGPGGHGCRTELRTALHGLVLAGGAALLASACNAADSSAAGLAGSATAQQMVDRAAGGQTIVLPANATGPLNIKNRNFGTRPLTIDLSRARISAVVIQASSGVRLINGTIIGNGQRNTFGVVVRESRNVEVSNLTITQAQAGISISRAQDVLIANNNLTGLISDGMVIAGSQRLKIYYNRCSSFNPAPRIYDAVGNMVKDGDHADCIQAWSLRGETPTGDLDIVGNRGYGNFQGIFLGNNVLNGVSDGGYDRVTITDNDMQVGLYNAIYIADGRNVRITRNRVSTQAGARDIRGKVFDRPIKAFIAVIRGMNVQACGNTVIDFPAGLGTTRC